MSYQGLGELAEPWRSLRRSDIFTRRPLHGLLALVGARPLLFAAEPLRRLVEADLMGYRDLLDSEVDLHLVTTDLSSGQEVILPSGDAASAVVAAQPYQTSSRRYAVRAACSSTVASPSMRPSAMPLTEEIYLLPTGFPCALAAAPTTAVGVALQAITLLSQQKLIGEVARCAGPGRLKVLPPLCPLTVSAADFSHADKLIARAKKATASWLDAGGPDLPMPQQFLSMHDHRKHNNIADREDRDQANRTRTL